MKTMTKYLTGAAAAAALAVTAASPAQAQSWDRYRDRDRGIDAGDVIAGVAVVGGIAALIAALDGDNDRDRYRGYGYDRYGHDRYGYDRGAYGRYGYGGAQAAVNACGTQAQRVGRNVRITDIDRTNGYYRVRGRVDVIDYQGRWNRRYDVDRERFTCYARNGRVHEFRA